MRLATSMLSPACLLGPHLDRKQDGRRAGGGKSSTEKNTTADFLVLLDIVFEHHADESAKRKRPRLLGPMESELLKTLALESALKESSCTEATRKGQPKPPRSNRRPPASRPSCAPEPTATSAMATV